MSEAEQGAERVIVEVTIAAPAGEVWDAIRDPEKLNNWFGWDAASLKDEIEYIFFKYGRPDEATRTLNFEGTQDRFEIEDRGDGSSVLRVIRAEPAGAKWDDIYEDMNEGWITFVQQLRFALERHKVGPRQTIFLEAVAEEGEDGPIAALGLGGVRPQRVGGPVSVALAPGDRVDGTLWHANAYQVGVTVPQWGDGLLVVTDKPGKAGEMAGSGGAILTTYNMSQEEFAELERRWTEWWRERFPKTEQTSASGC